MRTEELLQELQQRQIVIFGTGFVAERFHLALEKHRVWDRVLFCMATKREEGAAAFHGRAICLPGERAVPEDGLLCLAVHESWLPELGRVLPEELTARAVWIYPNLWELLFGLPAEKDVMIPLRELLRRQDPACNWISVRYAAIRDLLRQSGELSAGRDRYVRAMALHSGRKTAEKRYQALGELVRSMQAGGFDRNRPLIIDAEGHILDGLHRFAAALALGLEEVPCVVLPESGMYEKVLDERNRIPDEVLLAAGFSEEDMSRIGEAKKEIARKGQ